MTGVPRQATTGMVETGRDDDHVHVTIKQRVAPSVDPGDCVIRVGLGFNLSRCVRADHADRDCHRKQ